MRLKIKRVEDKSREHIGVIGLPLAIMSTSNLLISHANNADVDITRGDNAAEMFYK